MDNRISSSRLAQLQSVRVMRVKGKLVIVRPKGGAA